MAGNEPLLEGNVGGNPSVPSTALGVVAISAPTDLLNMQPDFTDPSGSLVDHDAPESSESLLIGFSGPGEGIGVLRENLNNPDPPFPELAERVRLASPINLVDPEDPPGLIIHGTEDTTVPVFQAQRIADAMAAAGVEHELVIAEGLGHVELTQALNLMIADYLEDLLEEHQRTDAWLIH